MSGKRKSPPNKFDGDSNSSQDFEGAATETGQEFSFQLNLSEIALSAAKMQQQFFNNNNNYNDNDISGCNILKTSDGIGDGDGDGDEDDEGEGEDEHEVDVEGKSLEFMGLGMGPVSASDGELTYLDIDTRSISPRASSNESELETVSQVSTSQLSRLPTAVFDGSRLLYLFTMTHLNRSPLESKKTS